MRSLLAGFTTRGRCFLAAGAAAALCGLALGERDLVRVGALVFLLPLLSALAAGRTRYRLGCRRQISPARVPAGQTVHVTGRFRWCEIAAVGEYGQDIALHRIGELRLGAGEWTQVAKALRPGADVGQHVEEVALGHAVQQGGFQRLGRR